MNKFIYREVGEVFEIDGKKLYFEESNTNDEIKNCRSCSLDNNRNLCYQMRCAAFDRPDNKNTIVKEITNAN